MIRLLSGIVLAAGALAAILFLPPLGVRILASFVAVLAAREYLKLVGGNDSVLFGVALFTFLISNGSSTTLALIPAVALFFAGTNAMYPRLGGQRAIVSAFSLVYISVPLGMLAAVHAARGWRATVLLIATVVVSDSLQFYTGRLFGRHLLAPAISPKKTIEGAIGGVVAGMLFMAFAGPLVFPEFPQLWLAGLGFVMALLGILGDLFESRLKREANVKDSSSLIPGHGGVLDRIDALLFVTPVFAIAAGVVR
jgi:phosphatidate cytidylyltransferase